MLYLVPKIRNLAPQHIANDDVIETNFYLLILTHNITWKLGMDFYFFKFYDQAKSYKKFVKTYTDFSMG